MPNSDCGMLIKLLADDIEKQANNNLRKNGLTLSQLRFMSYIYEHDSDQVPLKEIETYFKVAQPTVAGIMARMVKKGLVIMEPSPVNARAKTVSLTETGRTTYQLAEQSRQETESRLLRSLSDEEQRTFWTLLKKVNNGLEDT